MKTFAGAKKWCVKDSANNVERLRIISKCENQWAFIKIAIHLI